MQPLLLGRCFSIILIIAPGLGLAGSLAVSDATLSIPPEERLAGKRIRWIVPHYPGGGYDTYSRLIEPFLEERLKAEIVIENLPGAGGIVGAKTIQQADADGLTIGIINGPGLMAAAMTRTENVPNPTRDFTVLGRVACSRQVWATSTHSEFRTVSDLLEGSRKKAIVFGTRDVGSLGFVNIVVVSDILGLNYEVVPGYLGSAEGVLGAMRGEVDVVSYTFESILDQIENGDMRPLLQIAEDPISDHTALMGVDVLGNSEGVLAQHAKRSENSLSETVADVLALIKVNSAGRLIVAPRGMDQELVEFIEETLFETLSNREFQNAARTAGRSLDVARGREAQGELKIAVERMEHFVPVIRKAVEKMTK